MALTNTEMWSIYDPLSNTYGVINGLTATGYMSKADTYRIGNNTGTDPAGLGSTNWAIMTALGNLVPATPCDITNNVNTTQLAIKNLNSYFAGIGQGSLNTYLTNQNATPYTALARPNLAYLYGLALGYNPLTSTATTSFLTASNVMAPGGFVYGTNAVGASGAITYTNYCNLPYANNSSAVNCVQTLKIMATGGTLTLAFGSADPNNTTGAIADNVSATTLAADLNALPGLWNCVSVSAISGGFNISYIGNAANQNIPLLTLNTANLTGGSATIYYSTYGGQQGYCGPAVTDAVVTTTVNGTCGTITVTGAAMDSAGTYHASGRTFTVNLDNATAGTTTALTPTTSGDRLISVASVASAGGTASAGAFNLVSVQDR